MCQRRTVLTTVWTESNMLRWDYTNVITLALFQISWILLEISFLHLQFKMRLQSEISSQIMWSFSPDPFLPFAFAYIVLWKYIHLLVLQIFWWFVIYHNLISLLFYTGLLYDCCYIILFTPLFTFALVIHTK